MRHNILMEYHRWCEAHHKPVLIIPDGFRSIGNHHYRNDGMVYIGRRKKPVGPYMVLTTHGSDNLVLRFAEIQNVHRVEQARWSVLSHIKDKLVPRSEANRAELMNMSKTSRLVGLYQNVWSELRPVSNTGFRREPLNISELNVLDQVASMAVDDTVHAAVEEYLRLSDLFNKYYLRASRLDKVLLSMLRDRTKVDVYFRRPTEYVINSRTYVFYCGTSMDTDVRGWPSPLNDHIDLDTGAARYAMPKLAHRDDWC